MLRIKKLNMAIALFLAIIMLLSAIAIPGSQDILTLNSTENKKTAIYPLGDNESGINAVLVDVKVQKIVDSNGENNEWFEEIRGYIGDLIKFRINVSNNREYDLSKLEVTIEVLSEFLEYIANSARVNSNSEDPIINGDYLTWEVDELISYEDLIIEFIALAVSETSIEGAESQVSVVAELDSKYDLELATKRNQINSTELEIQQLQDIKETTKGELEGINSTIVGLEYKISENNTLLSEKQGLAESLSSEIIILNNSLSNNTAELDQINLEIADIESAISDEINVLILNFGFNVDSGSNGVTKTRSL